MGKRYENKRGEVRDAREEGERIKTDKETLKNEYSLLSTIDSLLTEIDDEVQDAVTNVELVGEQESSRLETEHEENDKEKNKIADEIDAELEKLRNGLESLNAADDNPFGKNSIEQAKRDYNEQSEKYKKLIEELEIDTLAGNDSAAYQSTVSEIPLTEISDDNVIEDDVAVTMGSGYGSGYARHLSQEEKNQRWKSTIQNVDAQIENYREALHERGVPDSPWLERTLSEHRSAMLKQESYELDVASGKAINREHSESAYNYPTDYPAFYDNLAEQFDAYCLEGTNPNFKSGPEWKNNCQRCVPTYEMRRRGVEAEVYPSTIGTDHLSHFPFDVWESPVVISSAGDGKSDIEHAMASWGDGSRAQIVVVWDDGFGTTGHTFIAEQKAGRTIFMDPQTNNKDVSNYFQDVMPGKTRFCRIDNLEISSHKSDCFKEVEK